MNFYRTDFLFVFLGLASNILLLLFIKNNFVIDQFDVALIAILLCIIDGLLLNWARLLRHKQMSK